MTSKDRIRRALELKTSDRVGIFDNFTEGVIRKWKDAASLPQEMPPQEYFDFDIRLFGFDQSFHLNEENIITPAPIDKPSTGESLKKSYEDADRRGKFLALCCMEPFEHMSKIVGREKLLTMMAEEAGKTAALFAHSLEFTLNVCQLILEEGYRFDGAWLYGDLGYKEGLIFSTDYYNAFLFDLHKESCDFFAKNDMPVIFHSDGNIKDLMPHLIEAGIRGIEPLESDVGMDLSWFKKEYGRDVAIFGGVDERVFVDKKKAENEIKSKFKYLMKSGGYVYRADSPIFEDIGFEGYKDILEIVKKYGEY